MKQSSRHSRSIELLAPAKDLHCGIEAIKCGADAVYIGAPAFSARAAAGNSIEEIEQLCLYAHEYGVRIYCALNTILKDEELKEAEKIINQLYNIGVDAIIVQDLGLTQMNLPPIALHASTQTDNRTVEKVQWLENLGFTQVVVARELDPSEIKEIASQTSVTLEAFIHGALCVSYSGRCYLSEALSGRSANRGNCAQPCRLPYDLIDANGTKITQGEHLLSLKDMNRSKHLEALLDAGVSSLKIEGRLKSVSYVKNITAYYRQLLDDIFDRCPEYKRTSFGHEQIEFVPDPFKSFNRGFTPYFPEISKNGITSFESPKSKGEPIGKIRKTYKDYFEMQEPHCFSNGDGISFITPNGESMGTRINKVEREKVYPLSMKGIVAGEMIFRNYNHEFEKEIERPGSDRQIHCQMTFRDNKDGFELLMTDERGYQIQTSEIFEHQKARSQENEKNIQRQLCKTGNTEFTITDVQVLLSENWFVPSSLLSIMRRNACDLMKQEILKNYMRPNAKPIKANLQTTVAPEIGYEENIYNKKARLFYESMGAKKITEAFEANPVSNAPLMFTKHCIRYSKGWCPSKQNGRNPYKEPLFLEYKGNRLRLEFDCKNCMMKIYQTK